MTTELNVVAIVLPQNGYIRVSKLSSPIRDARIPTTTLVAQDTRIRVRIWWPNGLPDFETLPKANLAVLEYLHELMLEKSVDSQPTREITAALASAILAAMGTTIEVD